LKGSMTTKNEFGSHIGKDREEAAAIGFIVHATWRIQNRTPEIHLYGRLATGETFLAIDTRSQPRFYVRTSEAVPARNIVQRFGGKLGPSSRRTMDGEQTSQVSVSAPGRLGPLRLALAEADVRTYEADVPFAWMYLIDRHLRGAVEIRGSWHRESHVDRIYRNPVLKACQEDPQLVVAALALTLDPQTGTIRAAALARSGAQTAPKVRVNLTVEGDDPSGATEALPSERDLLITLRKSLCDLDPDLITGWDVVASVLAPLKTRMVACGIPFNLGRSDRLSRVAEPSSGRRWHGGGQAILEGRQVLDARGIIRTGQQRFEDLSLATVAQKILGRIPDTLQDQACAILDILEADNLVQLTVRRSLLIGIPLQHAWTSVQAFDFLYLSELHQRGLVAPTRDIDRLGGSPAPGGLILSPRAGSARNILVLDFKSLYPSIIRTFNIDPVAQVIDPADGEDVIVAPNGAAFTRHPGILPEILDRFFDSRDRAKARGDTVASYAYKIIMNSFYGVLGTSSCRFASQSISGAITSFGQHLLRWTRDLLQEEGLNVIYGDTDSLFVDAALPGTTAPERAYEKGRDIAAYVNDRLSAHLRLTYGVESQLELEMEKVYTRFFLPTVRGEERGRAKGYAGLIAGPEGDHLDVVGMEAVRRDWTALARRFQRELLDLAFHDASMEKLETHVVSTLRQLRSGKLDRELVYQKSLRKPIEEYTKTQPPHVQAAARLPEAPIPGDVIRYVITVRGPRPVSCVNAPMDYGHIVEKQLRPIAQSLAGLVDIPEHLLGNGQIGLF